MKSQRKGRASSSRLSGSSKIMLLLLVAITALFVLRFHPSQYLTLEGLKLHHAAIQNFYSAHPVWLVIYFMIIYLFISLMAFFPVAIIMALASGAFFGFWGGLLVVCLGSTLGATSAFLLTRHFFRDYVQRRFARKLEIVNREIKADGAFYIFILRVTPLFPFAAVNMTMAVTPVKSRTFFLASFIGFLPGSAVYVNAGVQLARVENVRDILSVEVALSIIATAVLPLAAKKYVQFLDERKKTRQFQL